MLDSDAEGPGFKCNRDAVSNSIRQTVHTHRASVHHAAKLVAALLTVAGVTASLAESNGSLPPGLWLTSPAGWLQRTGISSGTLRSVIEFFTKRLHDSYRLNYLTFQRVKLLRRRNGSSRMRSDASWNRVRVNSIARRHSRYSKPFRRSSLMSSRLSNIIESTTRSDSLERLGFSVGSMGVRT